MADVQRYDKYILLQKLEQHAISETWRGADLSNGKIDNYYLIDFLDPGLVGDKPFMDLFISQNLVAAPMEHPNIMRKVTTLNDEGKVAIAHEHQEGFSLRMVIERSESEGFPFSIDHALLVTSKMLTALDYAKEKQISHGFLSPSMVFVTHEGEILVKGFSYATALRSAYANHRGIMKQVANYLPRAAEKISDEVLDIYACGVILFEMLTGHPFEAGANVAEVLGGAETATEGEAIPAEIKAILNKSLDPEGPDGYKSIQTMSQDMEALLFSGEYSPTTFNLAFFMHSAFRTEMEENTERLAGEKLQEFGDTTAAATPAATPAPQATSAAAQAPAPAQPPQPQPTAASAPVVNQPPPSKSKMPMILGAVALVAVIVVAVLVVPNMGGKQDDAVASQIKEELLSQSEAQAAQQLREQQEMLRKQNELLMRQLQEQKEREREDAKERLRKERQKVEEEIKALEAQKRQEEEQEALRKRIAQLEQEQKAIEEQEAQEELAKQALQEQKSKQANPDGAKAQTAANTTTPPAQGKEASSKPQQSTNQQATDSADSVATTNAAQPEAQPSSKVEVKNVPAPQKPKLIPPNPGDIVELDGTMEQPILLTLTKMQDVPRAAIRKGVVDKGKVLSFIMRVLVNEEGEVLEAKLQISPLAEGDNDYGMIAKAEREAKRLKFSPPSKLGVPVKVWMFAPIHFSSK